MKGFQVAPAELEGHILEHADVADCAVVPLPDTYSGEVPLAFVALHEEIAKKVASDPAEARRVKDSIKKVVFNYSQPIYSFFYGTSLTTVYHTILTIQAHRLV